MKISVQTHAIVGVLEDEQFIGAFQWSKGGNREDTLKAGLKSIKEIRKLVALGVWEDILTADEYKEATTDESGCMYTKIGSLYVKQLPTQKGLSPFPYKDIHECLACADWVYVYDKKKSSWIVKEQKPFEELVHGTEQAKADEANAA